MTENRPVTGMKSEQARRFDEEGLVAFLRAQPDIIAAYLFGSQATGRVHPGSDVDIAVLLDEDALPQTTGWGGPLLSRRLDLRLEAGPKAGPDRRG